MWEHSEDGHPAFSVSEKNGKIYCNIVMWENEKPDERGNDFSVQLKKENKTDRSVYIGNLKRFSSSGRIADSTVKQISADKNNDDLPF